MCLQQPELMVRRIAEFLGRSLTAGEISDIVRRTCFNVMKQDSAVNYSWWDELGMRQPSESQFMRKGIASASTCVKADCCQGFAVE